MEDNPFYTFNKIKNKGRGLKRKKLNSTFIATAIPVTNKEEINNELDQVKTEMKKATHNAWAYRLVGNDGILEDYDDNGELKGCGGLPILKVIHSYNLFNTLIIVTRYYGRKHLGPAELSRQYYAAADDIVRIIGYQELLTSNR